MLGDPATLTWTGTTNATWDTTTANNWSGATPNTFGSNDAVIFDDTTANRTVTLTGSLAPRSIVVNTTAGYTLTGGGNIAGGGSFVKNGSGTLGLAGTSANTFTGGFTLNAGTVALQTDDASNAALGAGPVTLNGGTLYDVQQLQQLRRLHRRPRRPERRDRRDQRRRARGHLRLAGRRRDAQLFPPRHPHQHLRRLVARSAAS